MGQIRELQKKCHDTAVDKGFWDTGHTRNNAEMVMLMVTELAEAVEGLRHNDWLNVGEEFADTVIRIMDFCEARGIDLESAIEQKMVRNKERPYKHGKKF